MDNLTLVASLIGGILIGLSASAMLLFKGKLAGISGIVAGLLSPTKSEKAKALDVEAPGVGEPC